MRIKGHVVRGIVLVLLASASATAQTEPRLRLIGNGALGLNSGENVQSGAFGVEFRSARSVTEITGVITLESTASSVRGRRIEDFATSILPIRNGSTAGYGELRQRIWRGLSGRGYVNVGNVDWVLEAEQADGSIVETREDGSVFAGGFTVLVNPLYQYEIGAENELSFYFGGGWTVRGIQGSLRGNEEFLLSTIGTTQTLFHGPEFVALLRLNDVEVSFNYPIFVGDDNPDDLRGGEGLGAVNISAGISIPLRPRSARGAAGDSVAVR